MLSLQSHSPVTSASLNVVFTVTFTCHICVPQCCLYSHIHLSNLRPSMLSLQSHSPVPSAPLNAIFTATHTCCHICVPQCCLSSHSPVTSASLNVVFTVTLSCARVTAGFIIQAASHDAVTRSEIDKKKLAEAHASNVTLQCFSHSAAPVKGFKSRFISPLKTSNGGSKSRLFC